MVPVLCVLYNVGSQKYKLQENLRWVTHSITKLVIYLPPD
jgi:hypothetical protein